MSSARAPDVRAEFDTNLKQEWIQRPRCDDPDHQGISNCSCSLPFFYHTPKLERWMMQKDHERKATNMERLMNSLKFEIPVITYYTPQSFIEDIGHKYILLFSCLLKSGDGKWLYFFRKAGYADSNLRELGDGDQKRRKKLEMELRNSHEETLSIRSIIASFDHERWAFCPVDFNDERQLFSGVLSFHNRCIFPFCARKKVKQGGTASVSSVLVQEDFIAEEIRCKLGEPYIDKFFGRCYNFAIKSYDAGTRTEIFSNERSAFDGLMGVNGIVQFFGSYSVTHGGREHHSIILELGKMDLFESYLENEPPQRSREIVANWKLMTNVAKAIRYIHNIPRPTGQNFSGIHADVKPDNILLVGDELKLADFGFAKFNEIGQSDIKAPEKLLGRTKAYGAPENNPSDKMDIWSFGCVLSINATWIVAGDAGVEDYEELRYQSNNPSKKEDPTDTFHDGTSVLSQVFHWHEHLRTIIRKSDTITPKILDVIEQYIFLAEPEMRVDAKELCEILERIIEDEEKGLPVSEMDDVEKALYAGELRRRGLSGSNEEANAKRVIKVTRRSGQPLRTSAVRSGLRLPQSGKSHKLSRPRPGISQRKATLETSLQVDKIELLSEDESGASAIETGGSRDQASRTPRLSVTGPNGYAIGSLGGLIQNHDINEDAKEKGKQIASSEADDVPESSSHQELAIAMLGSRHPPTAPPTQSEEPMSTITTRRVSPKPSHPVSDTIIEQPEETETSSMSQVSKVATIASRRHQHGRTKLMHAATLGDVAGVQDWLDTDRDIDISLQDDEGKTVLHHLVSSAAGRPGVSKELSTLISDIEKREPTLFNALDANGRSPLYLSGQNLDLVDTLVRSGARVDELTFIAAINTELDNGVFGLVDYYHKHETDDKWIDEKLRVRISNSKRLKHILPKSVPSGSKDSQKRSRLSFGKRNKQ